MSFWLPGLSLLVALTCSCLAQMGSECSDSKPCFANQECVFGYCQCRSGFVKGDSDCFPERLPNQECDFDAQCVDYRLKCGPAPPDGAKRCVCVKYYHWDEASQQCVTQKNLSFMLNDMTEQFDSRGQIEAETRAVFSGLVLAGLGVIVLGFILAFGCVCYGCCDRRWCGYNKLTPCDRRASCPTSTCPCHRRNRESTTSGTNVTGQQSSQMTHVAQPSTGSNSQATVDYLPGMYQPTVCDVI